MKKLIGMLDEYLAGFAMEGHAAVDWKSGLQLMRELTSNLIILDVMLPEKRRI